MLSPHGLSALSVSFRFIGVLSLCVRCDVVFHLICSKYGFSKYGNGVQTQMPEADGQGGTIECTCDVPARFRLPCQDVMAVSTCES